MLTVYMRNNQNKYSPPCDIANVAVYPLNGNNICGYIGAVWGEHVPDDVTQYQTCAENEIDAVLANWQVRRVVNTSTTG